MPKRYTYDLSHFSSVTGKIGHLQGLATIPIVAGDSFEMDITSVIRLSPLRASLTVDTRWDIFGFYIPYRHIYGDTWNTFIEEGVDETQSFTTVDLGATHHYHYACGQKLSGVVPLWITAGKNRIWNRFFRVPNVTTTELSDTYVATDTNEKLYGYKCAYLPSMMTPADDSGITDDDHKVDVTSNQFDIIDLERIKQRYKTEIDREWFTRRYSEILERNFSGTMINADAEERPELLFRHVEWMSGYDVDGTSEGSLGSTAGKSADVKSVSMPRKFFPEHGTLWIVGLLRYPTIVQGMSHYLVNQPNPDYKQVVGDPAIVQSEPPVHLQVQDVFQQSSSTTDMGAYPHSQWYRCHPSLVSENLAVHNGYPFVSEGNVQGSSLDTRTYVDTTAYDKVFASTQLAHFNAHTKFSINAHRIIPPSTASIYAGV